MNNNSVRDNEELYRSVRGKLSVPGRPQDKEYTIQKGKLIIRPRAFRDANRQPSVDRAELRNSPSDSLLNKMDGIVSLIAHEVRDIGTVITEDEGKKVRHAVNVVYDPEPDNPAHAKITVTPEFFGTRSKQDRVFELLKIALALRATKRGWTLEPPEWRNP